MLRVSIATVAEQAGVSASTVSRVFSGRGNISPETTQRVLQVAEKLGYVPRKYERQTVAAPPNSVCVLSSRMHDLLNNAFYSQVVSGIESVLGDHQLHLVYKTLVGHVREDYDTVNALIASQQGVIIIGYDIDAQLISRLHRSHTPLLLVDNDGAPEEIDCIINDNVNGMAGVVHHLIGLGHRDIAFIGGPAEHVSLAERHAGFVAAMKGAGLPIRDDWVMFCQPDFRIADGHRAVTALLDRGRPLPTAIVAANDGLAIGAVRALQERGLGVPADMSVAGFDDLDVAQLITPPLTTARVYKQHMGREAGRRLLAMMADTTALPLKIVLPTELVVRQSTGPPIA